MIDWKDIDDVLSINHPVKGYLPEKYELTPTLARMVNALPRKNKRIFPTSYKSGPTTACGDYAKNAHRNSKTQHSYKLPSKASDTGTAQCSHTPQTATSLKSCKC
jgi:hypothetical protein